MNKQIGIIILAFFSIFWSCSDTGEVLGDTADSIHYDTINFGSYYNIPMDSALFLSFKDDKNVELSDLQADSSYTVTVSLKGKTDIPFTLVSLNKNVEIRHIETNKSKYRLRVVQQVPTSDKYYAKLAVIPPDSSTRYIFRNRFWTDSTKSTYQEATMEVDTICKLTFKINNAH